ncbi:regulator of nonsense transcripts UPF3-like [Andrographis paniculata]|uniref:regulator of nonsense transcripts UPF3-like n=1 Tax=Andrographis paniculata TaxID=175694 RepID=UPI0021E89D58|nr:regulator of nonsense transcripts UPF3-like [Andrographis paniculata]
MKGPPDRTKVVVRHLPPTISQSNLVEHVDSRFSGRYNWLAFRPGKSSQKHLVHSRAYINFNGAEDVIEFAEFFNGHVFVNEKGVQFKAVVEYAPLQRVPKQCSKKDGREGTILKDPEYLEFLEFLAKPVESLPSAEIQLERKEAERAGAPKELPVVTPLMDYVRKKRAAKGGARRIMLNGKSTRRVRQNSSKSPASGSSKRGSDKRTSTSMYVLKDSSKRGSKDKRTYLLVSKQDNQKLMEKSADSAGLGGPLEGESGVSGSTGTGKKILLLKGKEKEIPVSVAPSQQSASSPSKTSHGSVPYRQNQRQEAGGRIIRSILVNKGSLRNQAPSESHTELQNQDRDIKPPRTPNTHFSSKETNGIPEDKAVNHDFPTEKQEKWIKNKDRQDYGIWTPRRLDASHSSNESLSLSASRNLQSVDSIEDVKSAAPVNRGGDYQNAGNRRGSHYSVDNGSYRRGGRHSSAYYTNDADGSLVEGKSSRRGVSSSYGSHEKQVWVQKSSSGS